MDKSACHMKTNMGRLGEHTSNSPKTKIGPIKIIRGSAALAHFG